MARFRGTVRGGREEATRLGHTTSGLAVKAQSYAGDVQVKMYARDQGGEKEDHVCISVTDHSGYGRYVALYDGPVADLLKPTALLAFANGIVQREVQRELVAA